MNAKELRIGNLVTNVHSGGVVEVLEVFKGGINMNVYKNGEIEEPFIWAELMPIPLTEKILLDSGFEKEDGGFLSGKSRSDAGFCRGGFMVSMLDSVFALWIDADDFYYSHSGIEIQSVHQLQNLYFALTGGELSIKL